MVAPGHNTRCSKASPSPSLIPSLTLPTSLTCMVDNMAGECRWQKGGKVNLTHFYHHLFKKFLNAIKFPFESIETDSVDR